METRRERVWPEGERRVRARFPGSVGRACAGAYHRIRSPGPETIVALQIAAAALLWRLVSAFGAFFANVVFPLQRPEQFTVTERTHLFWDALARFDSGWYFGIARNGYAYAEGGRSNLAFFPTYPMSMGYLGYWLGGGQANYYYAGLMISWASYVGAAVMLYRLARLDLDQPAAFRACLFLSIFPFAFFFGAVYTESLFLFLSVTTFYAIRMRRWVLAVVCGALVTCTRVNGILICPALALLVWQQWRHDPAQLRRGAIAVSLVPLGLVLYSSYVFALSGSFFEWAHSIRRWDYTPGEWPLRVFEVLAANIPDLYGYLTTQPTAPYDLLNGLAATLALCAVPFVWKRFGAPYAIYILANLALPLSSGEFEGLGRYTTVLFPFFLWLGASAGGQLAQSGTTVVFAMFYMLCQALFVTLHPLY